MKVLELVNKLKNAGIYYLPKSILLDDLLNLDYNIIDYILKVDNTNIIGAIELGILINKTNKNEKIYSDILIQKLLETGNYSSKISILKCEKLDFNDKLKSISIIDDCESDVVARSISNVISNDLLISLGENFNAYNIIKDCVNKKNIKYVENVLCNELALKNNIAIEGAKLITKLNNDFSAKYMCDVLCNEYTIKNNIAIEGAKILYNAKTLECAKCACNILLEVDNIGVDMSIYGAKIAIKQTKYGEYKLNNRCTKFIQDVMIVNSIINGNNTMSLDTVSDILESKKNKINPVIFRKEMIKRINNDK